MLGSLISAGASLVGGLFGQSNAKRQEALQREFAQNQLQWKAADAEKAGVSKIFAMGAPTHSYSPVSTGDSGIAAAGAALGRGIDGQGSAGGTTTAGKISGISAAIQAAQLEGLKIDNNIKRTELASKISIATQPGAGHIMDRDTIQGPEGLKLKKEIEPAGYLPNKSFGVSPEVSMYRTKEGYAPQIPQQLQEAFESDALSRWQWNIRNKLLPYANMDAYGTPPYAAQGGSQWSYDPLMGQYVLVTPGGSKHGPRAQKWEYMMDRLRR